MVFQTEKQLKEFGDKLPDDKRSAIQDASDTLKKAKSENNMDGIDAALENLNKCWQSASNEMQQAQAQAQAQASPNGESEKTSTNTNDSSNSDDVTDVDFEEVKDDK